MTTSRKTEHLKPDDPEQSKRFEDTARELGVDESGKMFERAVDTVVHVKPAEGQSPPLKQKPSE